MNIPTVSEGLCLQPDSRANSPVTELLSLDFCGSWLSHWYSCVVARAWRPGFVCVMGFVGFWSLCLHLRNAISGLVECHLCLCILIHSCSDKLSSSSS